MLPTMQFGRTGHQSTRTVFGAAALGNVSQDDTDRTMETILKFGVNHIDTAASYGDSEIRLGPWLARMRNQFFLATKTGDRTYQAAKDSIHRSLERMRVSNIDLIQLHNLALLEEWEVAMGPDGALRAAVEAKQEGLVRFIGVTGHGLGIAKMHLRSLQHYDFDTVLLPYNYPLMQNREYAADFEALLKVCQERNVGVQTIKAITQAPWGERTHTASTWYEPLRDQRDIDMAVNWVLGRPNVTLNTVGDITILPKVLDAATRLGARPTDAQMDELVNSLNMAPLFV